MDVLTADVSTSHTLASLMKVGLLYKKVTANPVQKIAFDSVKVKSEDCPRLPTVHILKCNSRLTRKNFLKPQVDLLYFRVNRAKGIKWGNVGPCSDRPKVIAERSLTPE